jgi:hypothetical protein
LFPEVLSRTVEVIGASDILVPIHSESIPDMALVISLFGNTQVYYSHVWIVNLFRDSLGINKDVTSWLPISEISNY